MRLRNAFLLLAATSLMSIPASAHHSYASHYDFDAEWSSVEGTVEQWWFVNPHVRIVVNKEMEDGTTETWTMEGRARSHLMREGWKGDEIQQGAPIKVVGIPSSRSGDKWSRHLLIQEIYVDGEPINILPLGEDVQRSFNDDEYEGKEDEAAPAANVATVPVTSDATDTAPTAKENSFLTPFILLGGLAFLVIGGIFVAKSRK